MWRATVLTIFPELFPGPLGASLAGKAAAGGLWSLEAVDIRDFASDRHRSVDDTPAGGGPGMVMRADVLARAIDAVHDQQDLNQQDLNQQDLGQQDLGQPDLNQRDLANERRPRLLMSARGRPLDQALVRELAQGPGVIALCGRFEGVDERVIAARGLIEVSIGDYVLAGGELAAMVLIDACVRLIPGVMGKASSGEDESFSASFSANLIEYPQYTRPQVWEGLAIPEVLTSGDHSKVAAWRRAEAERLTRERRPDLWAAYSAHEEAGRGKKSSPKR